MNFINFPLYNFLVRRTSLGCSPFTRRYLGNLCRFYATLCKAQALIYFPLVTKMFQFARYPTADYEFICNYPDVTSGWVAPFGNRRIKGFWLLPDEYRRQMRPSSVIDA